MLVQLLATLFLSLVLGLFTAPPVAGLFGVPTGKNPRCHQAWASAHAGGERLVCLGNSAAFFGVLLLLGNR
jgi:hypothetical protein